MLLSCKVRDSAVEDLHRHAGIVVGQDGLIVRAALRHGIRTKLLPYFAKRKMNSIQPKDIIAWQNEMIKCRDKSGEAYSPVYLKTLHNQLSAIFNHAVKFYGLKDNPAAKVGNMGKAKAREMLFWTQEEYKKFSEEMMDKPVSFYAFEMLYWCGIREGELLALTPADFDFERQTVTINKSYQRIGGRDIITDPKTPKSNRTIKMPEFLCEEMQDYITRRLTHRDVVVQGNPRVFKALRNQLAEVLSELQRIETGGVANDELLDLIEMIADILGGMKEESE